MANVFPNEEGTPLWGKPFVKQMDITSLTPSFTKPQNLLKKNKNSNRKYYLLP